MVGEPAVDNSTLSPSSFSGGFSRIYTENILIFIKILFIFLATIVFAPVFVSQKP